MPVMTVRATRCRVCHRPLISAEARLAGIGPVCFKRFFGKPLPRLAAQPAPAGRRARKAPVPRPAEEMQVTIDDLLPEGGAPDGE